MKQREITIRLLALYIEENLDAQEDYDRGSALSSWKDKDCYNTNIGRPDGWLLKMAEDIINFLIRQENN